MRIRLALITVSLLLVSLVVASAADPTVGSCTRKDEFAKKQIEIDKVVLELKQEKKASKQKSLIKEIVSKFGTSGTIENLIRYREPHLIPVFLELLKDKKWPIRARALYALKMIGNESCIEDISESLNDKEPQVRELAVNALGHIGGSKAKDALAKLKKTEDDPYVLSSIETALAIAAKAEKPYSPYSNGKKYEEKIVGEDGARRLEWAWTVKGSPLFNDPNGKFLELPVAGKFGYPISWYKGSLFASYPRNSFGGSSGHAAEDCAWFREGCSYYAIADGVVRMVQGAGGDWGFLIVLEHKLESGDYIVSLYGHAAWDVTVKAGDMVKCGARIATEGMSCSIENGGYGSHLHFGIGDGPFRRPSKLAKGDKYSFSENGKDYSGKIVRFEYADPSKGTNDYGWPRLVAVVELDGGDRKSVVLPSEAAQSELSWMQAYIKGCKGWLNPQTWLPEHVEGK